MASLMDLAQRNGAGSIASMGLCSNDPGANDDAR
jgi:hypothetical protein